MKLDLVDLQVGNLVIFSTHICTRILHKVLNFHKLCVFMKSDMRKEGIMYLSNTGTGEWRNQPILKSLS